MKSTKYTNEEIKSLMINNYPKVPFKDEPMRKGKKHYFLKVLMFFMILVFGLLYFYTICKEPTINIWEVIGGWPILLGIIGIIYTIIDASKEKSRYEMALEEYKHHLKEFEENRQKYIELVKQSNYAVEIQVVTHKEDRNVFHDAPAEYYINNFHVSQGTYVTTDIGDVLRIYKVEGYGIYLITLQKAHDSSCEYEIKMIE